MLKLEFKLQSPCHFSRCTVSYCVPITTKDIHPARVESSPHAALARGPFSQHQGRSSRVKTDLANPMCLIYVQERAPAAVTVNSNYNNGCNH